MMAPTSFNTSVLLLLLICFLIQGGAFCPTRQPFPLITSQPAAPKESTVCQLRNVRRKPVRVVSVQKEGMDLEANEEELEDEPPQDETYQTNLKLAQIAARCGRRGKQARTLALSAYDIVKNMTHPDTVAYNSVLKAFAKCSPTKIPNVVQQDGTTGPWVTAAERAQRLLEEMLEQHDRQAAASQQWYVNNAQGLLSDEELAQGPPRVRVKPNVRSFSTVMDAWSRMGNVKATLAVLNMLESRYEKSDHDIALQPNIFSYNTILSAYSKSKGGTMSAEQAEEFLELMDVEPDAISYNAVLHGWARSGAYDAGEHAEAILRSMPITPNARSYTTTMDAWSRSSPLPNEASPATRADALLQELKELYENTGDEKLKPNCVSYSTVINAYALSKEPQKAQRAYALLQEMITKGQNDPYVAPNTLSYNSVLNACATSSPLSSDSQNGEPHLQNIVQTLYGQLNNNRQDPTKKRLVPDHFTFGTVLKACANNIFWDDPNFGMYVFEEACRQGQVSKGVLVQLKQAVPGHVLQDCLPKNAYDARTRQFAMSKLPDSWKRNVRERGGR